MRQVYLSWEIGHLIASPHARNAALRGLRPAESLKNRLRALRAERGWTQAELATRLGVSRQTVNSVEKERYEPSLSLAFKLARLLGLSIEELFEST